MADYDRRRSGGGGGGGSGGGYRKRRYRDDDDDHHYDRRHNQRRRVDPLPVRLRRQVLGLADSPLRSWADEVQSAAALVSDNYEDEDLRRQFVDLVMQLHVEQPLKTPFVAAVVLVANTRRPELVADLLARLAELTASDVAAGNWRTVKLRLKLLACLQSCLEGEGVFPLLDELFDRAAELQTASSEDTIGTEIVKIILLTIPYIMAAAPGQLSQQKSAELMEKTDIIASEPHALQTIVDPFHPESGDPEGVDGSPSFCMLLQKQLQTEASRNWELRCLPRPWQMPLKDIQVQEKLSNPTKHALPPIEIPSTIVAGPRALFPEVHFSVYADQDVETVPPQTDIASSLIRDGLADTINILNFNRHAVARYLMDLDCYFTEGTFVKRATPFDDLRALPEGRLTWKPEDVAVDAVFSQLLLLPGPECKTVYYHSVLTEACKIAPAAIAPSLGRAIRYLYRSNARIDLELSYRFLDWFSHHLSNFGFTWKWAEWQDDTALPDLHPSIWFLRGALDKEVRLSFAQRIFKTVPDAYHGLIGSEKEQDVPPFKYADDGKEIATLLRRKAPDEEFQPLIDAIQTQAMERGLDPVVASTDVFTTAVCWVGSKSLSHVLACIDRTKNRLLEAGASSEAARVQIVSSVMSYWRAHPGVALSIVEKLLNYTILTPFNVIDWALVAGAPSNGTDGGDSLARPHVFEVVLNTVAKVTGRIRQIQTRLDAQPKAKAKADTDADANADADDVVGEDPDSYAKETKNMRDMFRSMNDALASWATGDWQDGKDGERDVLIRRWGQRWLRGLVDLVRLA
ncbi:nuclear cap-binding protein subunit 1 [Geosmithia morbida]|uniref:Nuclear cap-binding protein subunit 1 n=1 Tax=Geosmithia morbida TaxID=1094350 RepID=A0A9P5CYK2_9HYPO|nr:nuclear cap-binding protein subunit 1 [Geosmithia morbida]KAF4120528.1 nuclear cap-binding protein subunit 1 [Geosmithia morbida]